MKRAEMDVREMLSAKQIDWNAFEGARVLVTGATGLIGSLCVRALLASGKDVRVLVLARNEEKARKMFGDAVEIVLGDIRDEIHVEGPVDDIIHCASVTASRTMVDYPADTFAIAVDGTARVLSLAREKKVRSMVYLSSMEVYGTTTPEQNPVTEEKLGYVNLTSPRSCYPEGKRACEMMCYAAYAQYGVPVKMVRLAQTFGAGIPLSDNRMSMQFARSARYGRDIVLHTKGRSVSNFCYTVDAVTGIFTVLQRGVNGEAYNVCNDAESRTVAEIAQLIADRVADGKISVVFDIPEGNAFGYAPDSVMRLNSDKVRGLGWLPSVDMEDGYRRLVQYLEEEEIPAE